MHRMKFTTTISGLNFVAFVRLVPAASAKSGWLTVIALTIEEAVCSVETFLLKHDKHNLKFKRCPKDWVLEVDYAKGMSRSDKGCVTGGVFWGWRGSCIYMWAWMKMRWLSHDCAWTLSTLALQAERSPPPPLILLPLLFLPLKKLWISLMLAN